MKTSSVKAVRCAIYTRVSTDHGLDQEFNSLDAQYEAASAYIKSQAHAGWNLIRSRYDDGGYSGGSTDRPDLQRLLDDIRSEKIDVIVVYKVDRLTRSLADFAKLVELFDTHGVSFVSVTQQFNTTTSFVHEVVAKMMLGRGDDIRVSQMPIDGTFPSGTAAFEKRNISDTVAIWDADLCVQCGQCSFACPHSVIRAKYYDEGKLDDAPVSFKSAPVNARGYPDERFSLEVYLEDCTGCGICVEVCPAHSTRDPEVRAINLGPKAPILEQERANISFFETLPMNDRARVN